MDSGGLKEPLLDGVHIPAQQRQQPVQQPFIQVALDELVPEKKHLLTYTLSLWLLYNIFNIFQL